MTSSIGFGAKEATNDKFELHRRDKFTDSYEGVSLSVIYFVVHSLVAFWSDLTD